MFKFLKEKLGNLFKKEEKIEETKEELKIKKVEKKEVKKIDEDKVEKEEIKEESLKEKNKEEFDYALEKIEEEIKEDKKSPVGILERIQNKLQDKFGKAILSQDTFNEFFEELEELLLENNVSLEVVDKIKEDMEKDIVNLEVKKSEIENEIRTSLREALKRILIEPFDIIKNISEKKEPYVILFFGINGTGKTTTIAKLVYQLNQNKIPCVIAAADTFRAASIEQLKKHGEKLGVKIISQNYGSDPAAVAFDAIAYAKAHGIKAVLIDTAGRMHTKSNLLKEMEKIIRVCKPDLKIFVAESITGNDAVEQAKTFNENFGIDATILTKADVDERGGTMISIGYITKKPILFLGTGQKYRDLEAFSKEEIISNLGI